MCTLPQAEESEKSEESEEEHEETEEEFLERYAKTARELQEEAVEEAENGQDEDGHEIELGTSPYILLKCYHAVIFFLFHLLLHNVVFFQLATKVMFGGFVLSFVA